MGRLSRFLLTKRIDRLCVFVEDAHRSVLRFFKSQPQVGSISLLDFTLFFLTGFFLGVFIVVMILTK